MSQNKEGRRLLPEAWKQGHHEQAHHSQAKRVQNVIKDVKVASNAYSYQIKLKWSRVNEEEIQKIMTAEEDLHHSWLNEDARTCLSTAQVIIQYIETHNLDARINNQLRNGQGFETDA